MWCCTRRTWYHRPLPTLHEGGSDSEDDLDDVNQDDLDGDWEADLADVSPEDEAALAAFATPLDVQMPTQTLADIMLAKIRQRQAMLVPVPSRYCVWVGEGVCVRRGAAFACTVMQSMCTAPRHNAWALNG